MLKHKTKRRFFMVIWLILSLPVVIFFLVLLGNQANLSQAPGPVKRIKLFSTTNTAEISPESYLPELKAPIVNLSPDELFDRLTTGIQTFGWEIVASDKANHTIHLVVTTSLWKFKDDIRVTVIKHDNGSSLYAISQSRLGSGDLAANSHHLQMLLGLLPEADQ